LIQEKDKLVQLGLISTAYMSNKSLMIQYKYNSKNPMKQHSCHNNKQNTDPKLSLLDFSPNGDKGTKSKSNKTSDRHCNFCGKDGHVDSKRFKKMEALEETMKNHNIDIDSSSSSSHGHTFSASGFSFNETST
jgi:hypothetical protein